MKILGIYPYIHISSAALLINGKIVSAAQEERFNRRKMSTEFPSQSISWCLKQNNLKFKDLDYIVVPWNPQKNINHVSKRWVNELRWRGELLTNIPGNLMRMINEKEDDKISMNWGKNKLVYLDHHLCHAAFGYFQSSFADADILTIDGHGENETCFLGSAKNGNITKLDQILYPHSVGLFYGTFTNFLGFKPDSDEWKVMALSSYSTKKNIYDDKIKKLYSFYKNKFELDLSYFNFYTFDRNKNFFSSKFTELLGEERIGNTKLSKKHYLIAGAMQRHFETIVIRLLKLLKKKGKSNNLILGGGAAMNCVFNGKLDNLKIYKDSHISYAPDDSGVAIGAALFFYKKLSAKKHKPKEVKQCYYGPSFSNNKILNILNQSKIDYLIPKNINSYIAKEISKGKLVGWFQGGMEFGHRALGNRSILADPSDENIKKTINLAVKFRESFRPFAPAIMKEHVSDIMDIPKKRNVYFMERAYKFKNKWRKIVPGVCHADNTGRVQTVDKTSNLKFYNLINEFYKITKIPLLLNTSFNLNGEPIVMSPTDAIRTFYSCGLDILVLNNYVIHKKKT